MGLNAIITLGFEHWYRSYSSACNDAKS